MKFSEFKTCKQCQKQLPKTSEYFRICRGYYRSECWSCGRELCREYSKKKAKPWSRYSKLSSGAKNRNLVFSISFPRFSELQRLPCFYCGREDRFRGLDRVDNDVGYVEENVVPCCGQCNKAKHAYSQDDFLEMCRLVAARHPRSLKLVKAS